jgi:hypothetical protein
METEAGVDLFKRTPTIRVAGQPLPGFPIKSWSAFAIYVKELLKDPNYKIMGQKPGPKNVLMDIEKPEQVDDILAVGGEINICDVFRPLVG